MPNFVDHIVVVDDASTDRTAEIVEQYRSNPSRDGDRAIDQVPAVGSQESAVKGKGPAAADDGRLSSGQASDLSDQPDGASDAVHGPRSTVHDSNPRSAITLIRHDRNCGVGAAIATGYKWARDQAFDVTVVMAGDAQMDPDDLPAIVAPVARDEADYTKGNRLFTGEAWKLIPKVRYLGNSALSMLTKIASGYWHVADSQTGYTAISLRALQLVNWDQIYPRYGVPNDILVRLNVYDLRVRDVPVRPVYGIGEKSGIRIWRVVPSLSWLLLKLFLWRMKEKYVIRDFHPLVFFYALALTLL
ncbi:MAG: glycosyltransferase family 2 protein, partial [Armatimonadetes bacterium CG_4_8_14_3_um_filter_66_20]